MELYPVKKADLEEEWLPIIGSRELVTCIMGDAGFVDAQIALLEFKDTQDEHSFEVGIGECMRPYVKLYEGDSLEAASKIWMTEVSKYFEEDCTDEEDL